MVRQGYSLLEQHVIGIFSREREFFFCGERYRVLKVGKPQSQGRGGEPKTDVYILGVNNYGGFEEIKLSLKLDSSNELQENKMNAQRAESFFGEDYKGLIEYTARSLSQIFDNTPLVFASGRQRIKPNSITLGWKLEIANRPRALSTQIPLNDEDIRQFIYKGVNLPFEKRHAVVGGEIIENSGIADYILRAEIANLRTTNDVIWRMELIDEMGIEPTYMIFTANNYRTEEDSTDGPRPVAVRILWYAEDNKLAHHILYDEPLSYTGRDMLPYLQEALRQIGKFHPTQMSPLDLLQTHHFYR